MNFKQDFYKWYELNYEAISLRSIDDEFYFEGFKELPLYMRYGIYLQFFETKGVYPMVLPIINDANERMFQVYLDEDHIESFITMELAMDRAIEEAIKFYNKNV